MTTNDQSAGATPAAGGATPPQTPAQPAAGATTSPASSATDDDEAGLGETGKRLLAQLRSELKAAKAESTTTKSELEALKVANQTEAEKALAAARKEGATEVLGKAQGLIRRSEVKAALASAGMPANLIDLASRSDEFATLKVDDEGEVEGLAQAVESFKKAMPDLFKPQARPGGDSGLGPRGTPAAGGRDMNTLIRQMAGRT